MMFPNVWLVYELQDEYTLKPELLEGTVTVAILPPLVLGILMQRGVHLIAELKIL
jgi:hypothetical protein